MIRLLAIILLTSCSQNIFNYTLETKNVVRYSGDRINVSEELNTWVFNNGNIYLNNQRIHTYGHIDIKSANKWPCRHYYMCDNGNTSLVVLIGSEVRFIKPINKLTDISSLTDSIFTNANNFR